MHESTRNNLLFGPALALATVLIVSGCGAPGSGRGEATSTGDGGSGAASGLAANNQPAPDFELPDLKGDKVRLSDSAGRVRLIDFWATWCAPCKEEIPMLNALYREYEPQGLTVLGITSDDSAEVVRQFAEKAGIEYPNLIDPGEVSETYGIYGLPTAYLVDQQGKIVEQYFGAKPRKQLEKQIRKLLALPPQTEG